MLLLAGTRARREQSRQRVMELTRSTDSDLLARTLASQGLLALLGTRLTDIAPKGELSSRFVAYVETAIERDRRVALLYEHVTAGLASRLERAGIPTLVLKGVPLARRIYGDPGFRPTNDIDLLVLAPDLARAAAELDSCGYELTVGDMRSPDLPNLHYGFVHRNGWQPPVELHWRVHWYEYDFAPAVLERTLVDPGGVRRADAPDEIAMLLLYFARDGFVGLRYATDIAAWWDAWSSSLPPLALDAIVADHPRLGRALATAARQAGRLVGVPVERLLSEPATLDHRGRLALHLGNWSPQGDRDQVTSNRILIDWLLGPRGESWRFARRFLLPSRTSVVRSEAPRGERGPPRPLSRLTHAPKVILRSLYALWRVKGGRDWAPLPPSDKDPSGRSRNRAASTTTRDGRGDPARPRRRTRVT